MWRRLERPIVAALPFGLILGLALGFAVFVGANMSNAFPSEDRPFGWPGPSNFSNGVAMDRSMFVLAATASGLLLGLWAFRRDVSRDMTLGDFGAAAVSHLTLLFGGAYLGAGIGDWAASETQPGTIHAFAVSHALLASAFYALGAVFAVSLGPVGAPAGAGVWVFYVALFENITRWRVFRDVGYHGIQAGQLPGWFYLAQAASPIALYRGLLIIWHPPFRNWEEQAVLADANLPAWMTPEILGAALAAWIVVPLEIAAIVVAVRQWRRERKSAQASQDVMLVDPGPIVDVEPPDSQPSSAPASPGGPSDSERAV